MITAKQVSELRNITGAGMMDCKKALSETNGNVEAAVDWLREKGISKSAKKASRIAAEGLANIYEEGNKAVIVEVNSETDFVSKNEEFTTMIDIIGKTILNSNAKTVEEALKLICDEGTLNDLIVAKTAKIGEKLSLRRFELIEKKDNEVFGSYLHMGGKIAVLTVLEGANNEVARDVAMQAAAMKPQYLSEADVPSDIIAHESEVLKTNAIEQGKPAEIAEKMVTGGLKKYYKEVCLLNQAFIKDSSLDVQTYVKNNGGKVLKMIRYEVGEGMQKREENFAEEVMNQIK